MQYRVRTKTTMPHYHSTTLDVIRRYSDFAFLHQRLFEQNRGVRYEASWNRFVLVIISFFITSSKLVRSCSAETHVKTWHAISSFNFAQMASSPCGVTNVCIQVKISQHTICIFALLVCVQRTFDVRTCGEGPSIVHAGIIIPPIPEKNVVQKYQHTAGFLAKRRAALEKFINRVVSQLESNPASVEAGNRDRGKGLGIKGCAESRE